MIADKWFIENVADAPWMTNDVGGDACVFETDEREFGQIGYTLAVLQPGQGGGFYHKELDNQEDFLVLQGECIAIVENEEHHLKQWDFVHCPPGTAHVFVGAGDGPCLLFCIGARNSRNYLYMRNELAMKHGVSAQQDTTASADAYAGRPKWEHGRRVDWPLA